MHMCYHIQIFNIGLIIIFSVVFVPQAHALHRCPYQCKCSASSITCVNRELIEVPDFKRISSQPTSIDLSENEIEEITNLSFNYKNLEGLVRLKICYNAIFIIQANAFSMLLKLQHLDLCNNLLEDFHDTLIVHNQNLTELKLSGNLFGSKTPELESNSLEVLDLSFCKLSTFSVKNVQGLPNLKLLYLQGNNLSEMDSNIFGLHLQFIDLSFNAWKCECSTVQLFHHLVKNNLTSVSSPIQCIQSFRRYEDVYDSNGPVKYSKWCEPKITSGRINSTGSKFKRADTNNSDETSTEFKIWIGAIILIIVMVIVAGVCLVCIIKKKRRSRLNERSRSTIYSELSTSNTIVLQNCLSDKYISHWKTQDTV